VGPSYDQEVRLNHIEGQVKVLEVDAQVWHQADKALWFDKEDRTDIWQKALEKEAELERARRAATNFIVIVIVMLVVFYAIMKIMRKKCCLKEKTVPIS
jgi:hypothetical protein